MDKKVLLNLREFIFKHNTNIIILTHQNPDYDAFSSVLAF